MKVREGDLRRELEIALSWKDSQPRCANRLGIRQDSFKQLLRRARLHGVNAVLHSNMPKAYIDSFKLDVVNSVIAESLTVGAASARYNLNAPKYSRKAAYAQYKASIEKIPRKYKGAEIVEEHPVVDHVHMPVPIPPKSSVSQFTGYLKGKSSLMIFDKHSNLKYKFGNRHFWSEGYYAGTVGLNEATIRKYIQE